MSGSLQEEEEDEQEDDEGEDGGDDDDGEDGEEAGEHQDWGGPRGERQPSARGNTHTHSPIQLNVQLSDLSKSLGGIQFMCAPVNLLTLRATREGRCSRYAACPRGPGRRGGVRKSAYNGSPVPSRGPN